jgi:hypothetical protein
MLLRTTRPGGRTVAIAAPSAAAPTGMAEIARACTRPTGMRPPGSAYFACSIMLIVAVSTSSATSRNPGASERPASNAVGFAMPIQVWPPSS